MTMFTSKPPTCAGRTLALPRKDRDIRYLRPLGNSDIATFFACTFASGAQAVGTIGEFFRKMARPAGFEPATLGLGGQCAIPLSYGRERHEHR